MALAFLTISGSSNLLTLTDNFRLIATSAGSPDTKAHLSRESAFFCPIRQTNLLKSAKFTGSFSIRVLPFNCSYDGKKSILKAVLSSLLSLFFGLPSPLHSATDKVQKQALLGTEVVTSIYPLTLPVALPPAPIS